MKCQILFSMKNEKNMSLLSAKFAHSMVNVKKNFKTIPVENKLIQLLHLIIFLLKL